jgi:hypothetical protein
MRSPWSVENEPVHSGAVKKRGNSLILLRWTGSIREAPHTTNTALLGEKYR